MTVQAISDETAADILEQAADVIRTNGWCKGTIKNVWGNVCAVGAIRTAAGVNLDLRRYEDQPDRPEKLTRSVLVERHVRRHLDDAAISWWNDNVAENEDEVIDLFLEIAKDLRNGEQL